MIAGVDSSKSVFDAAIVGGGAAGLATAIFAARHASGRSICILDGAKKLGAKILVSGGGRCNVTNTVVKSDDYWGGSRNVIKRVLAAFPAEETVLFFQKIGVSLHEEEHGKLFPDSNTARTVLDALIAEAQRLNVSILTEHRVKDVQECSTGESFHFEISTSAGTIRSRLLVLATGGLSLAKTGSDGGGYNIARLLGHTILPTTPALAPLVLNGSFHSALSGLTHDVELVIRAEGEKPVSLVGSMLWTHFGISGPVAMNASRLWHRPRLDELRVDIFVNFFPGDRFETLEGRLLDLANRQPRAQLHNVLSTLLPARLIDVLLKELCIARHVIMGQLPREDRRKLINALLAWQLPIRDSRGYAYAEVTAGGVSLAEIDAATMQSRKCPGLYLVGEILDVDGRIGGYNFQWAWSGGFVAGRAIAAALTERS